MDKSLDKAMKVTKSGTNVSFESNEFPEKKCELSLTRPCIVFEDGAGELHVFYLPQIESDFKLVSVHYE